MSLLVLAALACGSGTSQNVGPAGEAGEAGAEPSDAAGGSDTATSDGGPPSKPLCDLTRPFGPLTPIAELSATSADGIWLTPDEKTAYLGMEGKTFTATRTARGAPFSAPKALILDKQGVRQLVRGSLSTDGLTLFVIDNSPYLRPYKSTRSTVSEPFSATISLVLGNNELGGLSAFSVRAAGTHLYFVPPVSHSDFALAVTAGEDAPLANALLGLGDRRIGTTFSISRDETTLHFTARDEALTKLSTYRSSRTDITKPFNGATPVESLSGTSDAEQTFTIGHVSEDGCEVLGSSALDAKNPMVLRFVRAIRPE